MFYLKIVLGCKIQIDVNIALGIDDGSSACALASDEVGSMSQTIQIELFEDHADLHQANGPPRKAALQNNSRKKPMDEAGLRRSGTDYFG